MPTKKSFSIVGQFSESEIKEIKNYFNEMPTKEILIGLNSVTDQKIDLITKKCTKLKLFDISHSEFVTDKSMKSIIENAPQIETLNVYECENLKIDTDLMNLLKIYLKLKILCISWYLRSMISKEKYPFVTYDDDFFDRSHYTYFRSK